MEEREFGLRSVDIVVNELEYLLFTFVQLFGLHVVIIHFGEIVVLLSFAFYCGLTLLFI